MAGALLLVDVAVTLVWQEPLSALYAHFQQRALAAELAGRQPLTALQRQRLARLRTERRRIAFLAGALARRVRPGQPIGRLRIRRMRIDFVVVQGTDGASLRRGPGHYPETPLPGRSGTVAIAGHRTTWLAPFRRLDRMRRGDPIVVAPVSASWCSPGWPPCGHGGPLVHRPGRSPSGRRALRRCARSRPGAARGLTGGAALPAHRRGRRPPM